jgi:hypothetical protein
MCGAGDVQDVLEGSAEAAGADRDKSRRPGQPEAGRRVIVGAPLDTARDDRAEAHLGHRPLAEQDLDQQLLADANSGVQATKVPMALMSTV